MHLLWRFISAYTGSSLCLGVFRTREKAEQARSDYIHGIAAGEIEDHWAEQAYHTVDLQQDLRILSDLPSHAVAQDQSEVFLVSEVEEAFGQQDRGFVALCGSLAAAEQLEAQLSARPHEFTFGSDIERLTVDVLVTRPQSVDERRTVWTPPEWDE